ncbi:MAG: hypothetical protein AB8B73_01350 [Ekhidna sp.]
MENDITMESQEQKHPIILSWWLALGLFVLLSSLFNYVYFKDIFLPAEYRAGEFEWSNFLMYNLGVKFILYPIKFAGMVGLMMFGVFLFRVEKIKLSLALRIVILAELVKYLPEVLRILWFTFIDYGSLEGYDMSLFNDNLSLNGLFSLTKTNTLYPLFKNISITQLLYIAAVTQLLTMSSNQSFSYHLKWFGITYGIAMLLLGMISMVF